jgi:adenylate cyclase
MAAEAGQDVAQAIENFTHLGIRIDDPDSVRFGPDDVELTRFLSAAVATFLTDDEGVEVLHVVATALSAIAEAAVAGHVQGPERRTTSRVENVRLNAAAGELGLELGHHLSTAFRHHLRQAATASRRTQSGRDRELATLTVGFLDLVGFTGLSQELPTDEVVALVKGFEAQAHEVAHGTDTRIVKLIGDEVMIVAEQPADAAAFVTGMVAALESRAVVPRGGLAHGDLINIHGDYFGPVVNLAARLVDSAVPGEVLVDEAVARQVATEPAGRRMLKGFPEPVRVHSLLG